MSNTILELNNIKKSFGETKVLRGIDLSVAKGEFITLLGSSGCGKTTTLRIIAGLEMPDSGSVVLEGADVTLLPPNKRNVNTVFQSYALFPHMSVEKNIAYGLKLKGVSKESIKEEVSYALELVQLSELAKRRPDELSGGQKQRVAIARAIINKPDVLLLDEPLSSLDLKLRQQMQTELKMLQKQLGTTFVYITHDQEEALNMSDRIAVMKDGQFEQVGSPAEIYDRPRTSYVATFVGSANILSGIVKDISGKIVSLESQNGVCKVYNSGYNIQIGEKVSFAVRSEQIDFVNCTDPRQCLSAKVIEKSFLGGMLRITVQLRDLQTIVVSRHGIDYSVSKGDEVFVSWQAEHAVFVDLDDDGRPLCEPSVSQKSGEPSVSQRNGEPG